MSAPFKWIDELIHEMIAAYKNGEGTNLIAKRYHLRHESVSAMLQEQGIVLRTRSEYSRECTCNHAYFHSIDTEEKAYWLGFLTADGCITTSSRITVHLGIADCSHLHKLKAALGATHKVSTNVRSCSFTVSSPDIAEDLARYGILPNKTFSTKPSQVAPELARHYWRGVIDGDGCISKSAGTLILVGDYEIVLGFQAFVMSHCPKLKANIHTKENIFTFSVSKLSAKHILQTLYGDANIFLERKHERAMEVLRKR